MFTTVYNDSAGVNNVRSE